MKSRVLFGFLFTILVSLPNFPVAGAEEENEETASPLSLSLATVRTKAEQSAVRLAVDFVEDINRLITDPSRQLTVIGENSVLLITPEIHLLTGSEDAFEGFQAKGTALLTTFSGSTVVAGVSTPDTRKLIHTVPISIGAETNGDFSTAAGIAEIGYVPWFQTDARIPKFLHWIKPGIFVQGGYKFARANPGSTSGGDVDQSEEGKNQGLARAKASALLETPELTVVKSIKVKLLGSGDVWYDFVNTEVYHRITGTFRVLLSKDRSFDFKYEHGSGAPNFNRGEQFSAGLTVAF